MRPEQRQYTPGGGGAGATAKSIKIPKNYFRIVGNTGVARDQLPGSGPLVHLFIDSAFDPNRLASRLFVAALLAKQICNLVVTRVYSPSQGRAPVVPSIDVCPFS